MKEFPALAVDGFVYMRTKPSTCLTRLQGRGRSEEAGVELAYLEQLQARHEEWLLPDGAAAPRRVSTDGVPVLVLECDEDFQSDPARCEELVNAILEFRESLA